MRRRKTIIVIGVIAALTLAIAGSAYAASGKAQSTQEAFSQAVQRITTQSSATTCAVCGEPIWQRDCERDCAGAGCDGICEPAQTRTRTTSQNGGLESQNRAEVRTGSATGTTVRTQTRTSECDGTCELAQTWARTQSELHTQAQVQAQTQPQVETRTQTETQTHMRTQTETQTQMQTQTSPQPAAGQSPGQRGPSSCATSIPESSLGGASRLGGTGGGGGSFRGGSGD